MVDIVKPIKLSRAVAECAIQVLPVAAGSAVTLCAGPIAGISSVILLSKIFEILLDKSKEERREILQAVKENGIEVKHTLEDNAANQREVAVFKEMLTGFIRNSEADWEELFDHQRSIQQYLKSLKESISQDHSEILDSLSELIVYLDSAPPLSYTTQYYDPVNDRPSDKANFRVQWVPLIGRTSEFAALNKFAECSDNFRWTAIAGTGGTGKSRLAFEWVRELRANAWEAGFLSREYCDIWLKSQKWRNWIPKYDCAIVIDYATEFCDDIALFMSHMQENVSERNVRIRLLFLARNANPIFGSAMHTSAFVKKELERAYFNLDVSTTEKKTASDMTEPVLKSETIQKNLLASYELQPIEDRAIALEVFKKALEREGKSNPIIPDREAFLDELLNITSNGNPLMLYYAASFYAAKGDIHPASSQYELLDYAIEREMEYHGRHGATDMIDRVRIAIGIATLCGGIEFHHISEIMRSSMFGYSQGEVENLKMHLRETGLIADKVCKPLEPDLLGEHFVLTGGIALYKGGKLPEAFSPKELLPFCLKASPKGWAGFIFRSINDFQDKRGIGLLELAVELATTSKNQQFGSILAYTISVLSFRYKIWTNRESCSILENILAGLSLSFNADTDISLYIAKAYVGIIVAYERAEQLDGIERLLCQFSRLKYLHPSNEEITLQFVYACFNAINAFAFGGRLDRVDELLKQIRDLSISHPRNEEIALMFANTCFFTITDYGDAGRIDKVEELLQQIGELMHSHPSNDEISLRFVMACIDAIVFFGDPEHNDKVDEMIMQISELRDYHSGNKEFALAFTMSYCNAVYYYGNTGQLEKVEDLLGKLSDLRECFKDNAEIALELTKACGNAIVCFGNAGQLDRVEEQLSKLSELSSRFTNKEELAIANVQACSNAIVCFKNAGKLDRVDELLNKLSELSSSFSSNEEIAITNAQACGSAIVAFKGVGQLNRVEELLNKLNELSRSFSSNEEIALLNAKAHSYAILTFGNAGQLDRIEEKLDRMNSTYRFPNDPSIALEVSLACFFYMVFSSTSAVECAEKSWCKHFYTRIEEQSDSIGFLYEAAEKYKLCANSLIEQNLRPDLVAELRERIAAIEARIERLRS